MAIYLNIKGKTILTIFLPTFEATHGWSRNQMLLGPCFHH